MDSAADVVVIGGGQSALAVGYFLRRRTKRDFVLLDAQDAPGGAWLHGWDSLRLLSPARWSYLPGWAFPPPPRDAADADECPSRDDVIRYLAAYEARYELPARRPVRVRAVRRRRNDPTDGDGFLVETDRGDWRARAVVSATGTWGRPFVPDYPGRESFRGEQVHSAHYRAPDAWAGKRVLVVGGGNSGAQILAEVSRVAAEAVWVTLTPPRFLPDDVDGRVLFAEANREFAALGAGGEAGAASGDGGESPLGSIVMVPSVREARARGVLRSVPPFSRFTARGVVWPDGRETPVGA